MPHGINNKIYFFTIDLTNQFLKVWDVIYFDPDQVLVTVIEVQFFY